ncbi:bifunctional demethylmenaquinone methyltransferase/2-methoxy-6-polyprenyl-1,4-benzoquinol methylase UbiE [Gammaproteobacteria bacterium]|jgi:demethylmenaquinone methyltransferase/2-methoxy-6-polyprenyl-1,4-benzoquinol methylase|nr:bifunctional demethylmenaquinone methyltransferase/2-methoxy-6-polyprenyl-1,4-benzoquinol methylase UbiE [SAR86 cluster bacterium]MDB3881026.1 bifunctional demethylmenaquinone methyltransferase/2-methoxy-6-polyprenyl-1,4-benzoquinol methylase UbiE [Gammaproteobacteria bacterium]MDB3976616.1 bifunctional demethylmenaquinone methyltransferase/2-methoxy-6-polyprenyl-1,4-benzoquinol methylase UbiE [Gammaproteobacteria bacterium]MDC0577042.1 bifunctional demethylmenaquinone methyltransferase/2-met|tara:strand:- start:3883 stop:4647 length:765 start_codon:yes stop_codon:yes gene_type:complete
MKKDNQTKTNFGFKEVDSNIKADLVGNVFDTVSKNYDLMNDLMSFGIHRLWKKVTIETSGIRDDFVVLDLAGGTGDMVKLMREKISDKGMLILSDINQSMLREGRDRLINEGIEGIQTAQIDAQYLPFEDNTFDLITIAFGLRNVTNKEKALQSIHNALKPGGKLVVLEFSRPQNEAFREIYDLFSFEVIPKIGELIAQTEESYRYLAESIRMHPVQEELKKMMEDSGFTKCKFDNLTNGVVAIHSGQKGMIDA